MHMWKQALGPEQFAVLAECLQVWSSQGSKGWHLTNSLLVQRKCI